MKKLNYYLLQWLFIRFYGFSRFNYSRNEAHRLRVLIEFPVLPMTGWNGPTRPVNIVRWAWLKMKKLKA